MDKENKTALLIIDMINNFDFDYGEILSKKALTITAPIPSLKKAFKKKNGLLFISMTIIIYGRQISKK
ncbi:hypothetical protein MEZE111188_21240 [Mesobacillus zeae]